MGTFPASDSRDVDRAVEAAAKSFRKWRAVPAPRRAEILFRAAGMIAERQERLAREMTREMGKVLKEARGDVQEAIDTGFLHAGEGRRLFGLTTPSELPNKFAMAVRGPIGVAGIITPWNFPLAIPSWKIFPALVAGNAVVWKPASDTPLLAQRFAEILTEAGLPPGVLNLVHGSGASVGTPLASHPVTQVISFTGSSEVGREISAAAGRMLKRVSLELGGKNAQVVLADADLDLALEGALWGAFGTTGQRCTATSRLILDASIHDSFVDRLVSKAKSLVLGDGALEGTDVGPVINEERITAIQRHVDRAQDEGAKLLCGGRRRAGRGFFFEPTIFASVRPEMAIAKEEVFGPVLSVIRVKGFEEAIRALNATDYGLSCSLYTRDVGRAFRYVEEAEHGVVYVNAPTIGAEAHLPFGGFKNTGNGHREGSLQIYEVFTEWKTIYVDYSGSLQKAQIDRKE